MTFETIIVEERNRVSKITLNRPEVLNAVNETMGLELNRVLEDLETNRNVHSIVLTGAGRAFCAGEDVSDFKARNFLGLGEVLRRKYHPIILRLRRMKKPIIAAVNGIAAGGGASIALACDIRVASELAGFKMAFIGMGLVPDAGSSYLLSQLIGPGRALELAITGRTVAAKEALSMGIVNRVVPPGELESAANELASTLAKGPFAAIGLTKQLMNEVSGNRLANALESEAEAQQLASESNDHREAVRAFLEKRPPKFS